jgi:hypothetical protein
VGLGLPVGLVPAAGPEQLGGPELAAGLAVRLVPAGVGAAQGAEVGCRCPGTPGAMPDGVVPPGGTTVP